MSTHIVSDVEYIANEILLTKNGSFPLSGTSEEIIASIPEKIWSCTVSKSEMDAYMTKYKISNVKTVSNGAQLRVISMHSPCENAVWESATLEDAFLYYCLHVILQQVFLTQMKTASRRADTRL